MAPPDKNGDPNLQKVSSFAGKRNKEQDPVLDAFFDRGFGKRYTLIGAADINGFVFPACDIVERGHGEDDTDPTRGTVDTTKFENYVRDTLVPNLGNYALAEPHSIVVMDIH